MLHSLSNRSAVRAVYGTRNQKVIRIPPRNTLVKNQSDKSGNNQPSPQGVPPGMPPGAVPMQGMPGMSPSYFPPGSTPPPGTNTVPAPPGGAPPPGASPQPQPYQLPPSFSPPGSSPQQQGQGQAPPQGAPQSPMPTSMPPRSMPPGAMSPGAVPPGGMPGQMPPAQYQPDQMGGQMMGQMGGQMAGQMGGQMPAAGGFGQAAPQQQGGQQGVPNFLFNASSEYNSRIIVYTLPNVPDAPPFLTNATVLGLDSTGRIHSMYNPYVVLTDTYWDCLAASAPLAYHNTKQVPTGPDDPVRPVGLLGMGCGTVARIMLHYYPYSMIEGFDIDQVVVDAARQFMGLGQLEMTGRMVSRVADVLSPDTWKACAGRYGLLIVDLFREAVVLPELGSEEVWEGIKSMLAPDGVVVINFGQPPISKHHPTTRAIIAARNVFGGLGVRRVTCKGAQSVQAGAQSTNLVGMSGPEPDRAWWRTVMPPDLAEYGMHWDFDKYDD